MANPTPSFPPKIRTGAVAVTVSNPSLLATTETAFVLQSDLKGVTIRTRDRTATLRIAYVVGGTVSAYITLLPHAVYNSDNLQLSSATLYLYCDKATVVEIEERHG